MERQLQIHNEIFIDAPVGALSNCVSTIYDSVINTQTVKQMTSVTNTHCLHSSYSA